MIRPTHTTPSGLGQTIIIVLQSFHPFGIRQPSSTFRSLRDWITATQNFGGNMAGTYSQIYIQIVFAVQGRQNLLQKEWQNEVFKYMSGIIKNKGQKPIIVNG